MSAEGQFFRLRKCHTEALVAAMEEDGRAARLWALLLFSDPEAPFGDRPVRVSATSMAHLYGKSASVTSVMKTLECLERHGLIRCSWKERGTRRWLDAIEVTNTVPQRLSSEDSPSNTVSTRQSSEDSLSRAVSTRLSPQDSKTVSTGQSSLSPQDSLSTYSREGRECRVCRGKDCPSKTVLWRQS